MKRLKVLTIVGTRPEGIKMAPVIKELQKHPDRIATTVCATGQHRELLDHALQVFGIRPDIDLNLMQAGQSLSQLTANLFTHLDGLIVSERPDWVLVQGDTTTVMVASMVAFYHRVRIGHVEAGLRTDNRWQPFPEEINRRITDLLADLYFAPTVANRQNLLREGIEPQAIVVTGNTIVDALQLIRPQLRRGSQRLDLGLDPHHRLILVTAHRRENFGAPLVSICRALVRLARRYASEATIIYPLHPNPEVQSTAHRMLSGVPNIILTEPLPYWDFVQLMSQSHVILTDSGGLQEEAPTLGIPVLVLRDVTERPEGVAAGVVKLVGTDEDVIVGTATELLDDTKAYNRMAHSINPYGDGRASQRIVKAICDASLVDLSQPAVVPDTGAPLAEEIFAGRRGQLPADLETRGIDAYPNVGA